MSQDAPPDRGHLHTERRLPDAPQLDALDTTQLLTAINDQDALVHAAVRRAIPAIARLVDDAAQRMGRGGRLIYLGAGTSGRLGVLDASECPPTFCCDANQVIGIIAGGDGALRKSSEGREDEYDGARAELRRLEIDDRDTVVGIAAGGTTPYVWGALDLGRERGCGTALITCVDLPAILRHNPNLRPPHHVIELITGPEILTGSTRMKAGTATKLALNMISTSLMVKLGKVWGNLMVDLRASNVKLRDRAIRILVSQTGLSREQASVLLDQAQGSVKVALVMAHKRVDSTQAQQLLATSRQQLRDVLGSPQ